MEWPLHTNRNENSQHEHVANMSLVLQYGRLSIYLGICTPLGKLSVAYTTLFFSRYMSVPVSMAEKPVAGTIIFHRT